MTQDLFLFFSIGYFIGYAVKGIIITKFNFLEEKALFMIIPFLIAFISMIFFLNVMDAYHFDTFLLILMSWFFAFGFCIGLVLCNIRQRSLGLIGE